MGLKNSKYTKFDSSENNWSVTLATADSMDNHPVSQAGEGLNYSLPAFNVLKVSQNMHSMLKIAKINYMLHCQVI
jgi:hypothetical protein